ncbi:hypothetical protein CLAFUW4_13388 [Fulvia fulva]|uniref:Heterokaryon incompatibility domain-containing protein n=1 Tax=Passalora fulva TaxID=5499 RepID=A0A9Q8UV68_PASFU|nr:uncharacterized protein CLAFUR5_13241 [Fulvia fulva]KAK4611522.1 hypothetical protein CLAFUR4_13392 [Fulvia fulva]KAK4613204.1 hypothetical protein CLAFUR0_13398 [Fulvia fulva]UJO23679.1 hypothetical protein CLAFUR5_13241 [Fulvia fulva]WPV21257.1 hypothetical protein CLAFUW4_13388 [Fulvia fulva]WPV35876.1 hypothetical protein CLAFUW7_13395 [Fulvia fulva]
MDNAVPQASSAYPAPPLESGQFRLLHLEAGTWADEIRCTLQSSVLRRGGFEAASYAWGPLHLGRNITLQGVPKWPVTDNAFDMLRRLRYTNKSRVLWMDALCINQNDLDE